MHKKIDYCNEPNDKNVKIWRFLDFTKFIHLLDSKSLYFNRADLFEDPFEGTWPEYNWELISKAKGKTDSEMLRKTFEKLAKEQRKHHFLNCWHINEYESGAMWKLYTKSTESVAIQSSFQRLSDSLKDEQKDVFIGTVRYLDRNQEAIPMDNHIEIFLHKRPSFRHEQELRAIMIEPWNKVQEGTFVYYDDMKAKINVEGLHANVNLDILIEKIYFSPNAPKWFKNILKTILHKYSIDKPVEDSELDNRPNFI